MFILNIVYMIYLQISVRDTVFDVLISFIGMEEEDVRLKALTGLGKQ